MEQTITINFRAKLKPVKPVNDEMTLCKCYIMALGKNANRSDIPQEAADDALATLYNIPVVGRLFTDEDGKICMGGHDMELEQGEDGKYRFRVLTVPYGVVPVQDNVHYEEVTEETGTTGIYQVANIILWTGRYPELLDAKYGEEIYFNQSMEIKPLETETDKDGYTCIKKFKYSALCLLGKSDEPGKNVAPCFPSARVEPYAFAYSEGWYRLAEEFKNKLYAEQTKNCFGSKGGKELVNMEAILQEFGIESAESLPFEIMDGMTESELREKLKEMLVSSQSEDSVGTASFGGKQTPEKEETAPQQPENKKLPFELTSEETRKALCDALASMRECSEVSYRDYWLCDFDGKFAYVGYCFAQEEGSASGYARFGYEKTDDGVRIDPDSFEKVRLVWLTLDEAQKLDKDREELAALSAYKQRREEEDRRQAYAAVLTEFSDLSDEEEYKSVAGNALQFESSEALREKLYAIRGKTGKYQVKRSLSNVKIPVGANYSAKGENEEQIFFAKYLPEAMKNE